MVAWVNNEIRIMVSLTRREQSVEGESDGFSYGHKIRDTINRVREYKERKQAALWRKW